MSYIIPSTRLNEIPLNVTIVMLFSREYFSVLVAMGTNVQMYNGLWGVISQVIILKSWFLLSLNDEIIF